MKQTLDLDVIAWALALSGLGALASSTLAQETVAVRPDWRLIYPSRHVRLPDDETTFSSPDGQLHCSLGRVSSTAQPDGTLEVTRAVHCEPGELRVTLTCRYASDGTALQRDGVALQSHPDARPFRLYCGLSSDPAPDR